MRKLVFEGIINGKKFDNVQDYNKEMNRLLSSGSLNISASSSTHLVDDSNVAAREPEKVETIRPFDEQDYLPFFNNDASQYYLDLLVSSDNALNERNMDIASQEFDRKLTDLKKVLATGNVSIEDAFSFVNRLKEVRSQINTDAEENRTTINEVNEKISQLTGNLQVLNNAAPVIATVSDYYDKAFELVKGYLLKF
jgi:methyl-accepting chemotaxis protein